jgi:hypothetical protein
MAVPYGMNGEEDDNYLIDSSAALGMTRSYCVMQIASPLRRIRQAHHKQAPYFALNGGASDFAKATPDKSQGRQGTREGEVG